MEGVRVLNRADGRAGNAEPLDLQVGKRYGVGVSWNRHANSVVDVDLQCVVVDTAGVIIDCAYYNNLKAVRAITHSGDEAAGKPGGVDEIVWIHFPKLPDKVALLIFVAAAFSGGTLQDVNEGLLHVYEGSTSNEIALVEMERSTGCVDVVAAMSLRGEKQWSLHIVDKPAQEGQHFMDILPLLGEVVRGFLPHAPARQKVAFAMEKGGVLDLPQDLGQIVVGLGWDVDDGEVDLDVSAVLLDGNAQLLEAVFFGRLESEKHAIKHTGDNLTGEGDGDDEQIMATLNGLGNEVQQIFFCVNIYTQNRRFSQVASPYCRVVDASTQSEMCRYMLSDAGSESGLIIAKIAREAGSRWGFHALGLPCRGRTWKDSMPQILQCCTMKTSDLMVRQNSLTSDETRHRSGSAGVVQAHVVAAPPKQESSSSMCVLQ